MTTTESKKYEVLLVDPPWSFKVWNKDTGSGRSAEAHYRTMSLKDICDLPVKEVCAPNCALFLWSVWPSIFDARDVIEAWGFKYKTLGFEWWKLNKGWLKTWFTLARTRNLLNSHDDMKLLESLFFFGMGYYTRTNSEPCLLATRGSMPVAVHNERNFIIAPVRKHSQKPDEQYDKIEKLYPNKRYLELFARQTRPNWTSLGYDIDGKDIRDALEELT